jgi:tetratricopeptide (TPR) repeat protein
MAEQQEPIRRRVALKVLKPGMDTRQVIARFEAERQALALMDHPHIARVLDAGATDSGRPYFVMELVKGVPITEFCDANHLPPGARLRLTLGTSFLYQGEGRKAAEQYEAARALYARRLGPDHPDTLASMNHLANSYAALGRHADAVELREQTLTLRRAKFGPDHPDTLVSMNNLANGYEALGRHADALRLRTQTLELRKAKLGPDHPDTLVSMHNLANSYAALGRDADALRLRQQTLTRMKAKLGPDHPTTLVSMRGVAESLVKLDRGAEAVPVIDEFVQREAGTMAHPSLLPGVMILRLRHFEKAKDAAGCRRTAEMWETLKRTDADSLYNAACLRAVTAAVLREADNSPEGVRQADAEAERAMAWLKQAAAAGYKNAGHMKQDRDRDALRDRADFATLMRGLEGIRD